MFKFQGVYSQSSHIFAQVFQLEIQFFHDGDILLDSQQITIKSSKSMGICTDIFYIGCTIWILFEHRPLLIIFHLPYLTESARLVCEFSYCRKTRLRHFKGRKLPILSTSCSLWQNSMPMQTYGMNITDFLCFLMKVLNQYFWLASDWFGYNMIYSGNRRTRGNKPLTWNNQA